MAMAESVSEANEYRYKLTIAINELLFDRAEPLPILPGGPEYDRAAGTAYPSLQMRGRADNVALLPEFVESSLRIKSATYLEVVAVDEKLMIYEARTLRSATAFDGDTIIWNENHPDEGTHRVVGA